MTLNGGIIQAVLFNNKMWDVVDAANWCLNHGHKVIKIRRYCIFISISSSKPTNIETKRVHRI